MAVSFQRLNEAKREVPFFNVRSNFKPVYMSLVTNGYTRILRFDNVPPPRASAKRP